MNYPNLAFYFLLVLVLCTAVPLKSQTLDEHELILFEPDLNLAEPDNSSSEYLAPGSDQELINLNTADLTQLHKLNFLKPETIQQCYHYLLAHRPLVSIYELQSPSLFTKDQLRQLMSLCYVDQDQSFRSTNGNTDSGTKNQLILRWDKKLPKSNEYLIHDSIPSAYRGSSDRLILRLHSRLNSRLTSNLIMEKDAGERWLTGSKIKLPDHWSANLQVSTSVDYFKNIIAGDFGVKFGRGLILDNASFLLQSNSPSALSYRPQSFIKANTSLSESGFLRGLAIRSIFNYDFELISFISYQYLDAHLEFTSDSLGQEQIRFSSLPKSGYHRTTSELKSKNNLSQWLAGMSLIKKIPSGLIGTNLLYSKYGMKRKYFEEISKRYIPSDEKMVFGSLYYNLKVGQTINTGEAATNKFGHWVFSHSSIVAFGKNTSLILTGYYYSPGFYAENSKVESTSGYSWNEKGVLSGLDIRFNKYWTCILSSGVSHPVLTDQIYSAPKETRMKVELSWVKRKDSKFKFQLQISTKAQNNQPFSPNIPELVPATRFIRSQLYYEKQIGAYLLWRIRLQWSGNRIFPQNSSGWFFAHDLNGRLERFNLKFWLRFSYFDTNYFKINFYAFENDLRYQYSVASYSGRGLKSYLKLGFQLKKQLTMESKIAHTMRYKAINSGTSEDSMPSSDWEFKTQVIYKF